MTRKEIVDQLLKEVLENIAAAWETARDEGTLSHDFLELFAKLLGPECEDFVARIEQSLMTNDLNWLGDDYSALKFRERILFENYDEIIEKIYNDKLLEVKQHLLEVNEQLNWVQERMLILEAENMGLRELIAKLQAGGDGTK